MENFIFCAMENFIFCALWVTILGAFVSVNQNSYMKKRFISEETQNVEE